MKLLNVFLIALTQASPFEKADASGISTASFDERTPVSAKIGCGRGTIVVTKVFPSFLIWFV